MCKTFLQELLARKKIMTNVDPMGTYMLLRCISNYAASKAAMHAHIESLQADL